ncbi:MAG: succinyl-diaminopimelate desuccinylase [Cellulomonadaceae bacterium]|nr:succinyl-diaminopimelate desuccinylase [Cellulomonadaceae bacterium]
MVTPTRSPDPIDGRNLLSIVTGSGPHGRYADLTVLLEALCNMESVTGNEANIADAVEDVLLAVAPRLDVQRFGNAVIGSTHTGSTRRIVLVGHLDTVPLADPPNLPATFDDGQVWARGTVDMKAGLAVMLALAAEVGSPSGPTPRQDITWVFYDGGESGADVNGLVRLAASHPEVLAGSLAIVCEPTNADLRVGCRGSVNATIITRGVAGHSARSWVGMNAIHAAAPLLRKLDEWTPIEDTLEGFTFTEAFSAVRIAGGVTGSVIPDVCEIDVEYHYSPRKSPEAAAAYVRTFFAGSDVTITGGAPGRAPQASAPILKEFARHITTTLGTEMRACHGSGSAARFEELGVPAVNFGPGDPNLAHTDDERVSAEQVVQVRDALRSWLVRSR